MNFAETGGASYQRWAPSHVPQPPPPSAAAEPARAEDVIAPKLGSGPQRHKYTVEQMLSIYASMSEAQTLGAPKFGEEVKASLLTEGTQHDLLELLNGIRSVHNDSL